MTILPCDRDHLQAEGWSSTDIDWAHDQHGIRSLSPDQAHALRIGCRSTGGIVHPSGLFFPYGASTNGHTYGQLRCHNKIQRPSGHTAPKYLPTVGVAPIPWLPDGCLAITEGWKDAAAPFIRHQLPVGAIGAPSYFRCLQGVDPSIPLILDGDTPFIKEVWRVLLACAVEQNRRIGFLPWMPDHPKGGLTEFVFAHNASQQDVMNVVGSAFKAKDFLFALVQLWLDAPDQQWQAANKNAAATRVPLLKAEAVEQLAKSAALCLTPVEAGSLFAEVARKFKVKKGSLDDLFAARQGALRKAERQQARRTGNGQPIYAVDQTTTLEATVLHNIQLQYGGGLVSRNLQFWRWDPDQHHWALQSGHQVKHSLAIDLENYYQPGKTEEGSRYIYSTTEYIKRVSTYLQLRLDDQRLDANRHLIPFTNGVLDLNTRELLPHSPDYGCTFCIQGPYSPVDTDGLGPAMTHLLSTSYAEPHHLMVRAAIRLLIDPTIPAGKCVVLLGDSRSGKGALLSAIRRMFPSHAISALSRLDQVEGKENIYQSVLGKRLIAFGDLIGKQTKFGCFYELVDQAMVTARRLFESEEITIDFFGRFVLAMTKLPIFADDDGNTGWIGRAFVVPTIPGQRDRSSYPGDLEADLAKEVGSIASWALAMDRTLAIDILQGRSEDEEVQRVQYEAASSADSLSGFTDQCLVPTDTETLPDQTDLVDAYRAYCLATNRKPLGDANFLGQLRKLLPHLHRTRQRMSRPKARDLGLDCENRPWTPAVFFGFTINPDIWRREPPSEPLPLGTFAEPDWTKTLANWKQHGWAFHWDRDSHTAQNGFLHKPRLADSSGHILDLKKHRPTPPQC